MKLRGNLSAIPTFVLDISPFLSRIEERGVLLEVAGGRSEDEKKRNGGGENEKYSGLTCLYRLR